MTADRPWRPEFDHCILYQCVRLLFANDTNPIMTLAYGLPTPTFLWGHTNGSARAVANGGKPYLELFRCITKNFPRDLYAPSLWTAHGDFPMWCDRCALLGTTLPPHIKEQSAGALLPCWSAWAVTPFGDGGCMYAQVHNRAQRRDWLHGLCADGPEHHQARVTPAPGGSDKRLGVPSSNPRRRCDFPFVRACVCAAGLGVQACLDCAARWGRGGALGRSPYTRTSSLHHMSMSVVLIPIPRTQPYGVFCTRRLAARLRV